MVRQIMQGMKTPRRKKMQAWKMQQQKMRHKAKKMQSEERGKT